MYDLAAMLKERRRQLGITSQERAAVQIGTTRLTYSKWESGQTPDSRWIEPICAFLDVPRWQVLNAIGLLPDGDADLLSTHYPLDDPRKEVFRRCIPDRRKHLSVTLIPGTARRDLSRRGRRGAPKISFRPAVAV